MTNETNHAREQAQAKLKSIKTLVLNYTLAEAEADVFALDDAKTAIIEYPLSVEVRDDNWYTVDNGPTTFYPTQFRILLCWGGPAVQIVGQVREYGNPVVENLQYQDWGTPWTNLPLEVEDDEVMQSFVEHFYFGD